MVRIDLRGKIIVDLVSGCVLVLPLNKFINNQDGVIGGVMKTYSAKISEINRKWYLVDATDQVLGRLASKVANILRGKHKPMYTPSMDTGDYVIVVNADKIKLTGKKSIQKTYTRYTGYPDGLRVTKFADMQTKKPEFIVENAIVGMIPHTKLGRAMAKKLKVFAGQDHPHVSQKPEKLEI